MTTTFCPKCGTPRAGSFRFCRQCGLDFDQDVPELEAGVVPPESPHLATTPTPQAVSAPAEVNVPALFVALGGLLGLAGSFLPWITATVPFAGSISRSGVEGGDGWISVLLGASLLIVGAALTAGRSANGLVRSWVTVALMGAVMLGFGIVELNAVQDRIKSIDSEFRSLATVGVGLWMIILGGALAAGASWRLRKSFVR